MKKQNRDQFLAAAIAAVMITCMFTFFTDIGLSGSDDLRGSEILGDIPDTAIPVSSADDLALVGSTGLTGAYPLSGYYYLTASITLTGTNNHVPIGVYSIYEGEDHQDEAFKGTFDGCGYSINGVDIVSYAKERSSVGFFGGTSNATIKNLSVTGNISSYDAETDIGGIVGYGFNTIILNCSFSGSITSYVIYGTFMGGIMGNGKLNVISDSVNYASLTSNYSSSFIGGIVGDGSDVYNSYNAGNITADDTSPTRKIAGGITGNAQGVIISNCYNTGEIFANDTAGGIAGYSGSRALILNCYNVVKPQNDGNLNLVGMIIGLAPGSQLTIMINCYAFIDPEDTEPPNIANGNYETLENITFVPDLEYNQESGGFSLEDLMPTLADAQANLSIYFTGWATVSGSYNYSGSHQGWDFFDVWGIDPEINNGLPYLRALYDPTTYHTVLFVDGEETIDVVVVDGQLVERPDDPEREGWNFLGWFTDDTHTIAWDFDTPVTENIILFAGWEEITIATPPADEKGYGLYLAVAGLIVMVIGIIAFAAGGKGIGIILLCAGALIFVQFYVYDVAGWLSNLWSGRI